MSQNSYTLLGGDGASYESSVPGTFGGHRVGRIYGRLDCPAACGRSDAAGTCGTGCSSPTRPPRSARAFGHAGSACRGSTDAGRQAAGELAWPPTSYEVWARIPSAKPSPGMSGELFNQPLGTATARSPCRSTAETTAALPAPVPAPAGTGVGIRLAVSHPLWLPAGTGSGTTSGRHGSRAPGHRAGGPFAGEGVAGV